MAAKLSTLDRLACAMFALADKDRQRPGLGYEYRGLDQQHELAVETHTCFS